MLSALHIENIAVVKSLDIDFSKGFTALTGETGAGKSIIIDSLGQLLGAKADKELIRSGETRATVSALFCEIDEVAARKISEYGFDCEDGTLSVSRVLTQGSSSARICGQPVTLGVLQKVTGVLLNIHGQNDNVQLLDAKNHLRLLDSFAENGEALSEYAKIYSQILDTRGEIESIKNDARERERLREMLKFQIEDIDALKLKSGEEEQLEELVKRLSDAEKIAKACALVEKALRGGDKLMGACYLVERAQGALDAIVESVSAVDGLSERLANIKYELEDISESTRDACDIGEGDIGVRLDKAQSRLSAIAKLKRKYGNTVEEILEYRAESARRLDGIENATERLEELEDTLGTLEKKATEIAVSLHTARINAARVLAKKVGETLAFLDMPKVKFEVGVEKFPALTANGYDRVEFLVCTNPGEPLYPMAKIASGGELARIMLSLKNVLNECDGIGTVIFDEIDTGISGKTSRKVGIKLKEIASSAQVICVTHSAQIASLAHNHLKIYKTEQDGRTSTSVEALDGEGRVEEIARILGGIEISDTVREAAREMIEDV